MGLLSNKGKKLEEGAYKCRFIEGSYDKPTPWVDPDTGIKSAQKEVYCFVFETEQGDQITQKFSIGPKNQFVENDLYHSLDIYHPGWDNDDTESKAKIENFEGNGVYPWPTANKWFELDLTYRAWQGRDYEQWETLSAIPVPEGWKPKVNSSPTNDNLPDEEPVPF